MPDYFEIILIGDTGAPSLNAKDPVFELLKEQLSNSEQSSLIFLGDNVYPIGIPPEKHRLREFSEFRLDVQLNAIKDYKGKIIFLSGNHDWNKGKKNGYEYVLRQEKYIHDFFKRNDIYHPKGGCPGPEEIELNENVTLVVINTQWWVQRGFRPIGKEYGCSVETEEEFFILFKNILLKNVHKRVLVVGHLPLYSYGMHGGKYVLEHHVFPLTIFKKHAYIPLPFIGSLIPLYRKYIGMKEDLSHPRYRNFSKKMKEIFKHFTNLIYAAGHEHNLQYIKKHGNHFIVSGAGSRVKFVKDGKYSIYTHASKGFFKLKFYEDKTIETEVWQIDPKTNIGFIAHNFFM